MNVSSHAHKQARKGLDFDDLQSETSYKAFSVYAKSKLANIYFTRELARRLDSAGVTANALHPGFVASRFGRDGDTGGLGNVAMILGRPFAISPEKGARTSVWLASSPDVAGQSGGYYYKCKPSTPTKVAARRRSRAPALGRVGGTGGRYFVVMPSTGVTPWNISGGFPPPSGSAGPFTPDTSLL